MIKSKMLTKHKEKRIEELQKAIDEINLGSDSKITAQAHNEQFDLLIEYNSLMLEKFELRVKEASSKERVTWKKIIKSRKELIDHYKKCKTSMLRIMEFTDHKF